MRNLTTKFILIALALLAGVAELSAQASKAFVDAPSNVFPLLDRTTRLDMIDYFNSGMSNASGNRVGGQSRITRLEPQTLAVEMTGASDYQLALLGEGRDSLVMLITTVKTPAPDSRVDFYKSDWTKLGTNSYFKKPELSEWLTASGRDNIDDVNTFVPFLLVSYSYDPATATLTLTNNTSQFLSSDIYSMVGEYLKDSLRYKWTGKGFKKID